MHVFTVIKFVFGIFWKCHCDNFELIMCLSPIVSCLLWDLLLISVLIIYVCQITKLWFLNDEIPITGKSKSRFDLNRYWITYVDLISQQQIWLKTDDLDLIDFIVIWVEIWANHRSESWLCYGNLQSFVMFLKSGWWTIHVLQ